MNYLSASYISVHAAPARRPVEVRPDERAVLAGVGWQGRWAGGVHWLLLLVLLLARGVGVLKRGYVIHKCRES